jgi:hypothetical protein
MAWQWFSRFLSATVLSATSTATNYPKERITTLDAHPYARQWRSTATTQQDIIIDFGSSTSVVALALFNTNFATVRLAHSTDNVTYTNFPPTNGQYTISKHMNYYKLFVAHSFTNRYVRIRIPAQTPTDGTTFFALGFACFTDTLNTLPQNPEVPVRETFARPYMRVGQDVAAAGAFSTTQELQFVLANASITQLEQIAALGEETPFVVYENEGDSSAVRLFRYRDGMAFEREGIVQRIHPRLEELV